MGKKFAVAPTYAEGAKGLFTHGPSDAPQAAWMDLDGMIFEIDAGQQPRIAVDALMPMIGQMGEAMYRRLHNLASLVDEEDYPDALGAGVLCAAAPWQLEADGRLKVNHPPAVPTTFTYSRERNSGWYVHEVRYASGAVGCVSRNYGDRRWRIVCDPREFDVAPSFDTRDEAAAAEFRLVQALNTHVASLALTHDGVDDAEAPRPTM